METRSLAHIAAYFGIDAPQWRNIDVCAIKRDNREVSSGDLFVAIRGENFDGHDFVCDAEKRGAVAALVERDVPGCKIPIIKVSDTVRGLQTLAGAYRNEFSPHVVGVTGSVGKTTTKEMIASVLSEKYNTLKTMGNLNNEIGLPFTICDLTREHEAAVIEMGMNHFGEISRLARVARPEVAVISVIGESHIEYLGSKKGILQAKLEILEGLSGNGCVILNGDDPMLWELSGRLPFETVYFGCENEKAQFFGTIIEQSLSKIRFSVRDMEHEFVIPCGGIHNLKNALCAIAVGTKLGVSSEQMRNGLQKFQNTGMRQKIIEFSGRTIINDSYNANPDSMRAALTVLGKVGGRRIAVLADMLELGKRSEAAHIELGEFAAKNADIICVTGNMQKYVAQGANGADVRLFDDVYALAAHLKEEWKENDTVLIKASRGMRLERVSDALCE